MSVKLSTTIHEFGYSSRILLKASKIIDASVIETVKVFSSTLIGVFVPTEKITVLWFGRVESFPPFLEKIMLKLLMLSASKIKSLTYFQLDSGILLPTSVW